MKKLLLVFIGLLVTQVSLGTVSKTQNTQNIPNKIATRSNTDIANFVGPF